MGYRTSARAVLALCAVLAANIHEAQAGGQGREMKEAAAEVATPVPAESSMRILTVEMDDRMRYSPPYMRVWAGESVRVVAINRGKVMHEIVVGTQPELEAHARHMREHPDSHDGHGNALSVPPGETREIAWRFDRRGAFAFGCLVPGHFEAGMVGHVIVEDR